MNPRMVPMTPIAIFPDSTDGFEFRAFAGVRQAAGRTAGEALDALTSQMPAGSGGTLIIVQSQEPDRFFSAPQQQRLAALMTQWREARDQGTTLPDAEQAELDALAAAEVEASEQRSAQLLRAFGQ